MTAVQLAEMLGARPAGRKRWIARCPAHDDRHPSLTITQGHSGVLLKDWSHGCTPEQITAALGMRVADLFDAPMTQATRCEVELRRATQAIENERKRRRRVALMAGFRACTRRMAEIADAVFNGEPEITNELGREFHDCLDFQRSVEGEVFS